nr:MAG TPA: hypothetical protein [Caudoviricetes sp.]
MPRVRGPSQQLQILGKKLRKARRQASGVTQSGSGTA